MKFSVFQLSRRGGRIKNEDRMGYCYTREAGLFVLTDGMGGHPDGEVAAQIALQSMSAVFQRDAQPQVQCPKTYLSQALLTAHHQIVRYANAKALLDTPRTTVVACIVQAGYLHWVHCGDSRLYVIRGDELLTRTRDHSYIEVQEHAGANIEGMNRNILFTCLGSTVRPMFDIGGPLKLKKSDKVLLCSDGLWGALDDQEIVQTLAVAPVHESVPQMVDRALYVAGEHSDNVTAIAVEWETLAPSGGLTETATMSDSDFASTIQASNLDPLLDDLDEEAIERSIAEINETIRRSADKH